MCSCVCMYMYVSVCVHVFVSMYSCAYVRVHSNGAALVELLHPVHVGHSGHPSPAQHALSSECSLRLQAAVGHHPSDWSSCSSALIGVRCDPLWGHAWCPGALKPIKAGRAPSTQITPGILPQPMKLEVLPRPGSSTRLSPLWSNS